MALPNILPLTLFVMTMAAVQGLPTRMIWTEEADTTTPSLVTDGSFHPVTSSEKVQSSEDGPSSEVVPTSDEENIENERQEGYNMDSTKSPPEVMLEEWQIKKVLDARENMIKYDSALIRNKFDMDQPIVNITEEQMVKLLPYYRSLFNGPLEQPTPSFESRARRTTQQRICPADPEEVTQI